jgi:hypothetical protein
MARTMEDSVSRMRSSIAGSYADMTGEADGGRLLMEVMRN